MRLFVTMLATLLLFPGAGARADQSEPVSIRVLTYNIHHGEGTDRRFDLDRLAEIIKSTQPDLVALQEVDQGTERAGGVNQLDELALRLGMHAEFGKAMDHMGGAYGVAVLSRWPIESAVNEPLPSSPDSEPRTALTVRVRAGPDGPLLRITSTHLDQSRDADDRLSQANQLNKLLASDDGQPTILAGDFNARPGTDVMEILHAHWTNPLVGALAPSDPPGRRGPRGDFVLFRPAANWRVIEASVVDAPIASDHRPVLAVTEWIGQR